jgi:large conductance mechanosensitive channel
MSGFKNFILRGNLVELAVAFIMAAAFAAVVTSFVAIIMDLIGKAGGTPNFSKYAPGGVHVGAFLTALISFLVIAVVVYFFVVKPYTAAKERYFPSEEEGTPADIALLTEIRDLLARQGGSTTTT